MSTEIKRVPDGYHTATPYMIVKGAAQALEFYKRAFDAQELFRVTDPDGVVRHAEFKIGDSPFMLTDENREFPDWLGPNSRGGASMHIYLYVEDCDGVFARAISAGAREINPMGDKAYGDRSGGLADPFGHVWWISSRVGELKIH
jgi:PhnB protein